MPKRPARLTTDETLALVRDAQAGSINARNRLIEANIGLIRTQTAKVVGRYLVNEFLSAGVFGFIAAVGRFEPERGYRLSTFAARGVHYGVLTELAQQRRAGRINNLESEPASEYDDGDEGAEAREFVSDCLKRLPARLAGIIKRRMEGETLEEIGRSMGVSRERVRQLQHMARKQMLTGDFGLPSVSERNGERACSNCGGRIRIDSTVGYCRKTRLCSSLATREAAKRRQIGNGE